MGCWEDRDNSICALYGKRKLDFLINCWIERVGDMLIFFLSLFNFSRGDWVGLEKGGAQFSIQNVQLWDSMLSLTWG